MNARFPAGFGVPSRDYLQPTEWVNHLARSRGIEQTYVSNPGGTQTSTKVSLAAVVVLGAFATYAVIKHPDAVATCFKALAPAALVGVTLKFVA